MTQEIVSVLLIDPNPWQPRGAESEEHIANLATSIADDGLMQIPSARRVGERYQIAFGHSRLAAFRLLAELQSGVFDGGDPDSPMGRALAAAKTAADNLVDFEKMPLNIMDIDDEQMFRFAVSENVQRKDLNAVETAQAMRRYKDEFNRTSAEVGQLFGVNESTVRGTLRLLDLPGEAQIMLAKGEISQGAARSLLSMGKIVSVDNVVAVAKQIHESDGKVTSDRVVFNALDGNHNLGVVKMWDDQNEGKPRAVNSTYSNHSWLLNMQNFPNRQLEPLELNDLPAALGIDNDSRLRNFQPGDMNPVAHFYRLANKARNVLDLTFALKEMHNEEAYRMAEKIEVMIDPPACTACPFYTKISGVHYCGLQACHTRKYAAWDKERIAQAASNLKILLYSDQDGPYVLLECSNFGHNALWKEKSKDLRIIARNKLKENERWKVYQWDWKVEDIYAVVAVRETAQQLIEEKKEARVQARQGVSVANNRSEMFHDLRDRLIWDAADVFADQILGALPYRMVKALFESVGFAWQDAPKWVKLSEQASDEDKFDFYRKRMALSMLNKYFQGNHYSAKSMRDVYDLIQAAADAMGVVLPGEFMRKAIQAENEIEIRFPMVAVSVETEG